MAWKTKEQASEYNRRWHRNLFNLVLATYGASCACCGESRPYFLSLDHVHPIGKKRPTATTEWRKAIDANDPTRYRVLCFNCNLARSMRSTDGICPCAKERYDGPQSA